MKIKLLSVSLLLSLLLGACSVPKDVTYFQGIDALTPEQITDLSQNYTSHICQDDLLSITVTAWDPIVVTPFNPPAYAYTQQGDQPVYTSPSMFNYLVDKDGEILFPVLGKIHVEGLTKKQLSEKLQKEISQYVENPLVNVQILNYKVTLMGEVSRPGTLTIRNDRLSILDAIGQAGDLTINAERTNILVIRENGDKKEFARLDITRPDIFTSPYYYLQQNDVVYIEPNKAKKRNARYSQAQQYNITLFSSILSAVSVITTVIVAITK